MYPELHDATDELERETLERRKALRAAVPGADWRRRRKHHSELVEVEAPVVFETAGRADFREVRSARKFFLSNSIPSAAGA